MSQPSVEGSADYLTDPASKSDDFPPKMMTGGENQKYLNNAKGELSDGSTLQDLGYGENVNTFDKS